MSDEILVICSFCKRIRVEEAQWVEVEEAVRLLELNEAWPLPQLSHSVCEACFADWESRIEE